MPPVTSDLLPPVGINLHLGCCSGLYIDCGLDSVRCKVLVDLQFRSFVKGVLPETDTVWCKVLVDTGSTVSLIRKGVFPETDTVRFTEGGGTLQITTSIAEHAMMVRKKII